MGDDYAVATGTINRASSGTSALSWRQRLNRRFHLDRMPVVRKVVYSVIGLTILLLGVVMIVLPGPAIVFIPLGLAVLASEYAWARRIIRRGRVFVEKAKRSKKPFWRK